MKKLVINGEVPLTGSVPISGSKNAALPIMAATLLCDETVVLHNVPILRDTIIMAKLLEKLGKVVEFPQKHHVGWQIEELDIAMHARSTKLPVGSISISSGGNGNHRATYDIVKQMRASICVLGPLLAKHLEAEVSLPGGCVFGPRPVDLHLKAMEAFGAKVTLHHGYIRAEADHLLGCKVDLLGEFGPSVLATDNAVMVAALATGSSVIEDAAREPETVDLINFLNAMGANIKGAGNTRLLIEGVKKLHGGEYTIIPDRIEAGSFMTFAAITGGEVLLQGVNPQHLKSVLSAYKEIGVGIEVVKRKDAQENGQDNVQMGKQQKFAHEKISNNEICNILVHSNKNKRLQPVDIHTMPYPFFPTDMQPLIAALLTAVNGNSVLREGIYHNRFGYVAELVRMGAKISVEGASATIHGGDMLDAATVESSDLRGGAALVAAALAASGETHVRRVYHIERGYENLPLKLLSLGAKISLESDNVV